MNGLKQVARVVIGTESCRYGIVIPNVDAATLEELLFAAEVKAMELNEQRKDVIACGARPTFLAFEFKNEVLDINESPLYIHRFIKEDNYPYETPTVTVHGARS